MGARRGSVGCGWRGGGLGWLARPKGHRLALALPCAPTGQASSSPEPQRGAARQRTWAARVPMSLAPSPASAANSAVCSRPPSRATFRTARSLVRLNSRPSVNSSRCTPSCATDWTCRKAGGAGASGRRLVGCGAQRCTRQQQRWRQPSAWHVQPAARPAQRRHHAAPCTPAAHLHNLLDKLEAAGAHQRAGNEVAVDGGLAQRAHDHAARRRGGDQHGEVLHKEGVQLDAHRIPAGARLLVRGSSAQSPAQHGSHALSPAAQRAGP